MNSHHGVSDDCLYHKGTYMNKSEFSSMILTLTKLFLNQVIHGLIHNYL